MSDQDEPQNAPWVTGKWTAFAKWAWTIGSLVIILPLWAVGGIIAISLTFKFLDFLMWIGFIGKPQECAKTVPPSCTSSGDWTGALIGFGVLILALPLLGLSFKLFWWVRSRF